MLPILTSERLTFRAWTLDDAAAALVLYGDPEITRYIGGITVADLDEARDHLALRIGKTEAYPDGFGGWAVVVDGAIVGTGLLKPLPDAHGNPSPDVEVGWHVARAYQGRGIATEVGRRLIRFGHEHHGLDVVHAVMEPANTASMRVAERLGMVHQGISTAYYGGERLEHYLWTSEGA